MKNTASVENMENLVKSCQKEVLALKIYSSDMDDVVANNMGFLGGCIQITQRISEPQLRDAVVRKLGMSKDDANMYARQLAAALSNVLDKWRRAVDASKMHPAVKQIGDIGRLQPGYKKTKARATSRSRSPSRTRVACTPGSASGSMSPGSIYKAYNVKVPTGIPLSMGAKTLRPHTSDPISIAPSPGGAAAAPKKNLPTETGDKKKKNEKLEIFTVDYERMLLIGQSGGTTTEYKVTPGPDGMCTANVHGEDKATEVPNAMYETWLKKKKNPKGAPLKRPAAAAKKPAGAWGEEERAPTEEEDHDEGEEEEQLEPDEVEAEDEEAPAVKKAKPAAAAAPERNYTVMWYKRDGCSAVRENFGNKHQVCSIGKKSDHYTKAKKVKAAEKLVKLLHEKKSKLLAQISAARGHM